MAESFRSPAKVARRLKMLPQVVRHVKNWPAFMYHYALGFVPARAYRFRNGAALKIGHAPEHAPIIEVFMRGDYGAPPDHATIVDLGANIGAFSIHAVTVARSARVYAYEPMPPFYQLLQENIRLNRKTDSISCFNYAVGGKSASRELFTAGTSFFFPTLTAPVGDGAVSTRVQCITLAAILDTNQLARVDLLKMDVEGAEYEILYHTPSDYFARIKEVRMEYHNLDEDRQNVESLKRFLIAHGYVVTHEQSTTPTNGNLWMRQEA